MIAITSENKFMTSGGYNNTVHVWNLQEKCQEAVLKGHKGNVCTITVTSDYKLIVSDSSDRTVRAWNLQEKR